MPKAILGVDIGGTFTDLSLLDTEKGRIYVAKVPSTPENSALALAPGLQTLMEDFPGATGDITSFSHGTTVGTNTLLQRSGARTGLITTEGFADLLVIGRQTRPSLYDLYPQKPPPLVPEESRLEVRERVSNRGEVLTPLDADSIEKAVSSLAEQEVESVAICFLFSFLHPEHEQAVLEKVEELLPEAFCSASCDVLPEFREFERLSTTVANAYLGPILRKYLDSFLEETWAAGITAPPQVMQSNSGLMSLNEARSHPAQTLLSGPCAGVIGAQHVSALAGFENVISFDMGGTSTEVSLSVGGVPRFRTDTEIDRIPIKVPMVDVHTIGAGGGSIAWVDEEGFLKAGPQSQGADPGPACYGMGGEEPTVTDANVLLGRLHPGELLGGRMKIDRKLSEKTVREKIGDRIGKDTIASALGILEIVRSNMVLATRLISVQRGHDARDFALVAYGGAGPLHAVELARELGIRSVIVPRSPGILCALGLLVADERSDFLQTRKMQTDKADAGLVDSIFADLERRAADWLEAEQVDERRRKVERKIDMRYHGQNYELTVPAPGGDWTEEYRTEIESRFHAAHRKTYGHEDKRAKTELVTFRVTAIGVRDSALIPREKESAPPTPAAEGERQVCFSMEAGYVSCPVFRREVFLPGHRLSGPAIVEQLDTTTLIDPCGEVYVDAYRNLIITLAER